MKITTPEVRLISEPKVNWDVVSGYLHSIGAEAWLDRVRPVDPNSGIVLPIASDAELLAEYAGRRCYKSWVPGLNANVTKVREDSGVYLGNILASKHGAVLEHAQFTFDFENVSRVFTHELVRHRAGVAISQESLRYVRLTDLGFRVPDILEPMHDQVVSLVEKLEEFQRSAADAFGLDDEGVPFHYKKEVTSALRRLAPLGLSTGMVWSANVRTLRHVLQNRTAAGAEEEIRLVFHRVGQIMQGTCPKLFNDFARVEVEGSDVPAWVPEHEKV